MQIALLSRANEILGMICLITGGGGGGVWSYVTITRDTLDLTVQDSPLCMVPVSSLLVTSGGQEWRPV